MKKILEKLGINPLATPGTVETVPSDWAEKFKMEEQKKQDLEKAIHMLERQNRNKGLSVDRAPNTEEQQLKLKALLEDLRVWKQKVLQTQG